MRGLIYRLLDWLTDRLVDVMIMIEPRPPRRQTLDYHVTATLPEHVLAIIRISWYKNGKPDEVDEVALLEDGDNGYDAFHAVVSSALQRGANVSIRSGYQPEDLGIQL
jgi:hypothetical protein